jgi:hypothetical protein
MAITLLAGAAELQRLQAHLAHMAGGQVRRRSHGLCYCFFCCFFLLVSCSVLSAHGLQMLS